MIKCVLCGDITDCFGFDKNRGFICLNCLDEIEERTKIKKRGGAKRETRKVLQSNKNKKVRR